MEPAANQTRRLTFALLIARNEVFDPFFEEQLNALLAGFPEGARPEVEPGPRIYRLAWQGAWDEEPAALCARFAGALDSAAQPLSRMHLFFDIQGECSMAFNEERHMMTSLRLEPEMVARLAAFGLPWNFRFLPLRFSEGWQAELHRALELMHGREDAPLPARPFTGECRAFLGSVLVRGEALDPTEATKALETSPTRVLRKGDMAGRRRLAGQGLWCLEFRRHAQAEPVTEEFEAFAAERHDALARLAGRHALIFDLALFAKTMQVLISSFRLPASLLPALAPLGAAFHLDVYPPFLKDEE